MGALDTIGLIPISTRDLTLTSTTDPTTSTSNPLLLLPPPNPTTTDSVGTITTTTIREATLINTTGATISTRIRSLLPPSRPGTITTTTTREATPITTTEATIEYLRLLEPSPSTIRPV